MQFWCPIPVASCADALTVGALRSLLVISRRKRLLERNVVVRKEVALLRAFLESHAQIGMLFISRYGRSAINTPRSHSL